jgi:hypothetical protein
LRHECFLLPLRLSPERVPSAPQQVALKMSVVLRAFRFAMLPDGPGRDSAKHTSRETVDN